jgi:hypothetical protein
MSHPVADYLNELYTISGVSVPETSGYPALSKLLNAVGESLKPMISTVINPANNGAGIPDGGLYSAKELKKYGPDEEPLLKLKPERGVIEVKPLSFDLAAFESGAQVRGYLKHYGQILLTNYRAFAPWSWVGVKAVAELPAISYVYYPTRYEAAELSEREVERGKRCFFFVEQVNSRRICPAAHY